MTEINQSERLTIRRFAGIDELELEIKPFTVLIGPQSVGKSLAAKVLYTLKSIPKALPRLAEQEADGEGDLRLSLRSFAYEYLGAPGDAEIRYDSVENQSIRLANVKPVDFWLIQLPPEIVEIYHNLVEQLRGADQNGLDEPGAEALSLALRRLSRFIPSLGQGSQFIPAGRAIYSQIEQDFATFFRSSSLDPFVSVFGSSLAHLKKLPPSPTPISTFGGVAGEAARLVRGILDGDYLRENKDDAIVTKDGRKVPARFWSSGQQEAHPLSLYLQRCCEGRLRADTLFIEEPEAHLFPDSQRLMTELISLSFRAARGEMRMFITTHSPYILTQLNNLLLAGQLYQEYGLDRRRLDSLVPEDRTLDPKDVSVYYMDHSGCRSIIDEETGLIQADAIDQASETISDQFNDLLSLVPVPR
jgi:hypothetical protein